MDAIRIASRRDTLLQHIILSLLPAVAVLAYRYFDDGGYFSVPSWIECVILFIIGAALALELLFAYLAKDVYVDMNNIYLFGWFKKEIVPINNVSRAWYKPYSIDWRRLGESKKQISHPIIKITFRQPTKFGRTVWIPCIEASGEEAMNIINFKAGRV